METIIRNLLHSDNEVIKKASADLQEAFKNPDSILALCNIVVSSTDAPIRQYSAVLLRKRLTKLRNWQLLPEIDQQKIKVGMLHALTSEPEKSVRNAIAQFVGVLVKHESSKQEGAWMSEVLKFIFENCSSSDPRLSELGSSVFATLADVAPDQFIPHLDAVTQMFTAAMAANEATGNINNPVIYNILVGMGHLVPFIIGHNSAEHAYQQCIPSIVKALQVFAVHDPDKFVNAFDNLDNFAEAGHKIINPHLHMLIEFCMDLGRNDQIDQAVRVKAISFVGFLVRLKKKTIIKLKLVEPIVQILFKLMASEPEIEDEEEEYFSNAVELSSPMSCSTQTMDLLALHIAPEKLLPPLLALVDPAIKGDDPLQKKAAYLSMAVVAEGCSEAICSKYLRPLLDCVKAGISDSNPLVRNSALFALGQFAEHLQPEISQFANEILPLLFDMLDSGIVQMTQTGKEPKHIDRLFYAMESFCEELENELVPHLPILMERLFVALDRKNSVHWRELVLSIISSAATAAKAGMLPYFPRLIEELKVYLVKTENEEVETLKPVAIDTLATLARNIGKENFLPLVGDTMNLGLLMIEDNDDPDCRQACFNLFSALGEVVGTEISTCLPKIVDEMLKSVKSTEGIIPDFKDGEVNGLNGDGDDKDDDEYDIENSDGEDDDDDDDDFNVENAYQEEKEEAIAALKELAQHTGEAFAPYLQVCFEEIYKLISYPNDDIRKVSIEALTQFTLSLYDLKNVEGAKHAITILFPKYAEIVKTDDERIVVMAALDGYSEILKKMTTNSFQSEQDRELIFGCITEVMNNKVACQFSDPDDEEVENSEYDEAIIQAAADLLPRFGNAMTPQEFAMYFGRINNALLEKLEKSKRNEDLASERSFIIGAISECFKPLKEYSAPYIPTYLPILISSFTDESNEVRNNSVFGVGELVLNSDEASFPHYPAILASLSDAVAKESNALVLDNICGAIARLIITNSSLVPLPQVLPVFVKYLPLREDFEENFSVYRSLHVVYTQGREEIVQHIDHIIGLGLQVLYKKEYTTDESRDFIYNFLKQIRQDFPDRFMAVVNTIPEFPQFFAGL